MLGLDEVDCANSFFTIDSKQNQANPSQLKKLVLENAGMSFDIVVHFSLPSLTSLEISGLAKASKGLEWLCNKDGNVWPQELELCTHYPIDASVLGPALNRLQKLRKLTFSGNSIHFGAPEGFLEDSFPELETLKLNINDSDRLGLLKKARLPALLHLSLKSIYGDDGQSLTNSLGVPWVQQLQSLAFNN